MNEFPISIPDLIRLIKHYKPRHLFTSSPGLNQDEKKAKEYYVKLNSLFDDYTELLIEKIKTHNEKERNNISTSIAE